MKREIAWVTTAADADLEDQGASALHDVDIVAFVTPNLASSLTQKCGSKSSRKIMSPDSTTSALNSDVSPFVAVAAALTWLSGALLSGASTRAQKCTWPLASVSPL